MDDKTFIAKFAADETTRINERLKKMVSADKAPSEEEKKEIMADIEETLARLQNALTQIKPEMLEEDYVDNGKPS